MKLNDLIYFAEMALVAYGLLLVGAMFFRNYVLAALHRNGFGLFLMGAAVVAVWLSSFTTRFGYVLALTLGGFIFGWGLLIALPDRLNEEKLLNGKFALRALLLIGGVYIIYNYVLVALFGEAMAKLWGEIVLFFNDVASKMSWEIVGWLVLGLVLVLIGTARASGYVRRSNEDGTHFQTNI